MHPVTAGSGFVTALNLPSLSQLLVHPVPKSLMAHLAGTLDPASLLLHRHRHLPIVHIQSQLQDPIAMLPHTCSVATTAQYCLVRFIHRADSLAAGAVSCRLMSSTFREPFGPSTPQSRPNNTDFFSGRGWRRIGIRGENTGLRAKKLEAMFL